MRIEIMRNDSPFVNRVALRNQTTVCWGDIPAKTHYVLLVGHRGLREWTIGEVEVFCRENEETILHMMNAPGNRFNNNDDGSFFGIFTRETNSYQSPTTDVTIGAFAVEAVNRELVVYALTTIETLYDNFIYIESSLTITCKSYTYPLRRGFFERLLGGAESKTYYEICISAIGDYNDGDVAYKIGDYKYPISENMVGQKFYLSKKPDGFVKKDGSEVPYQ